MKQFLRHTQSFDIQHNESKIRPSNSKLTS